MKKNLLFIAIFAISAPFALKGRDERKQLILDLQMLGVTTAALGAEYGFIEAEIKIEIQSVQLEIDRLNQMKQTPDVTAQVFQLKQKVLDLGRLTIQNQRQAVRAGKSAAEEVYRKSIELGELPPTP